ncbi:MAG: hypothetical protein HOP11_15770 [Saprospiraceae bacterium]|nr:hypothetical protein [Saprospiraceae bacterium]
MWIWKSNSEIDKLEWDLYLAESDNPFIEHSSWYLDICTKYWGAFFNLKNNSRIAIPYSKLFGLINNVTRAPYLQRLKIISPVPVDIVETDSLLEAIRNKFSCGYLSWDYYHKNSVQRANYILTNNTQFYNQSQKRNLIKSNQIQLQYQISYDVNRLMNWLQTNGENYVYKKDFNNKLFVNLVTALIHQKVAFIVFVVDTQNIIIGAAIFTRYKKRLVFFLSFNSKEGKKSGAMVGLIYFIQTQVMTVDEILDLEGSDLHGVATFYEGFGAKLIPYYAHEWKQSIFCNLHKMFKLELGF